MKAEEISCWKCGSPLPADTPLPLSRRSKCRHCKADLHVCRLCRFYDTSRNNSCSEPMAERVTDKERRQLNLFYASGRIELVGNTGSEIQRNSI